MKITQNDAIRIIQSQASKGIFIVFEGINGCGKTTILNRLNQYLAGKGRDITTTHEPGATSLGLDLRKILLEKNRSKYDLCPTSELLLFAADRHQHVSSVIAPALAKNGVVLCDRYHYSTTCFQGFGRGVELSVIDTLNKIATGSIEPDLVLLLDLSVEEGLRRSAHRNKTAPGGCTDAFESENRLFHERVRKGYLSLTDTSTTPFFVIDTHQPIEAVWEMVRPLADELVAPTPFLKCGES
jgi:dTMP kinase